ncbi:MAG: threonylcarbamoyl-AMP synthase [Verrucomicrobia bacterium]|nr:threonylcarbamoyl-AMP synthase [Verrucomicrobiota bacterium]
MTPLIETVTLRADLDTRAITLAAEYLNRGDIVALPTETVYGLAGDALRPGAVAKIFAIKERPYFDPLIVHIADRGWLPRLTTHTPENAAILAALLDRYWPGPLTILFQRTILVPDLVTAGRETVAIRCPRHPVFHAVLRMFGNPIAAPSANRFGRISPTRAEHVNDELNGRVPLILDSGPTPVGIESTIIQLVQNRIEILRAGPISIEELSNFAPVIERNRANEILAAGQTASHYAPKTKMSWFQPSRLPKEPSGLICWGVVHHREHFSKVASLSEQRNLAEAATRLFGLMRQMDEAGLEHIFVDPVPEQGIGRAIMNRLKRAIAAHSSDSTF